MESRSLAEQCRAVERDPKRRPRLAATVLLVLSLATMSGGLGCGTAKEATRLDPNSLGPRKIDKLAVMTIELAQGDRKRGAFALAEQRLRETLDLAAREKEPRLELALKAALGQVLSDRVFYDNRGHEEALRLLAETRKLAVELKLRAEEARVLDASGMVHYSRTLWTGEGSYATARQLFLEALVLLEPLDDKAAIAESLFHVGLTYEQEKDTAQAKVYYERSTNMALAARDSERLSYPLRHLAGLREQEGDLDGALALHRRCLALRTEAGLTRGIPFALIAIGDILHRKKDPGAESAYQQALEISVALENEQSILWSHVGLGQVQESGNNLEAALQHYHAAFALADKRGLTTGVQEIAEHLARVYTKKGDTSRAEEFRRRTVQATSPVP